MPLTIPFQPKAIQELWDPYGRMNATLGVELPFTTNLNQTTIPMGYAEPVTENIIDGQPQIWKITHNGVDTHPVHFHMMNVQLINRVGWDGAIRPPDANELGWKEVVKMNPLEDAIVALVPKAQTLPAQLRDAPHQHPADRPDHAGRRHDRHHRLRQPWPRWGTTRSRPPAPRRTAVAVTVPRTPRAATAPATTTARSTSGTATSSATRKTTSCGRWCSGPRLQRSRPSA